MQGIAVRPLRAWATFQVLTALSGIVLSSLAVRAMAQVQVVTQHNDNSRTGQNLEETVLTQSNVNVERFGKLWSSSVDGDVYGQPLYVPNVNIPGKGTHNVLYIVTEHDSVYALDADSNTGNNTTPLWQTSFINPSNGITTVSDTDVNCIGAIDPEIGITSTPVIDTSTHTIYVLAATKEQGNFLHRLHALDMLTGAEKFGGPVAVRATYPGTGDGSSGGVLTFTSVQELNRAGLLLSNGEIYISFASYCDNAPFHGWLMAYDKTTLQQSAVWVSTPNGGDGGIWMSGAGIAADDSGNIFFATGNGTFDTLPPPTDFGDSSMKMALNGSSFTVEDYFTPNDEYLLDIYDLDLSSSGVLLLPDQSGAHVHELVEAGKEGTIYLVDRDDMGEFNPNNKCVQNISGQILAAFSGPAYWNNYVYFGSAGDDGGSPESLKAFSLTNGLLSWPAASATPEQFSYPGPTPSVSANGTSNAIVWALETSPGVPAVLHAYDAGNLGMELYNSNQNRGRDILGSAVKFAVPTIADGKVYVGTVQQVSTYGLLTATTGLTTSLPQGSYVNQSVTFTAAVTTSGPPATGTVTFTSNASPIPECPNPVNVGGTGIAQCVTRSLAIGNDSIKASYSGDQNYSGSSANLIQTVNPIQDFFITSFPTTAVTVTQGYNNVTNPFTVLQSTMTVTTAPLPSTPGFSDPLGVTCTVTPAAGQSVSSQTIPTCVMAPPANNASITCSASTCSFPGQGGMATVTISAGRLTPIGPYAVTITATDQSAPTLFHVTTLSVNVINRSSPVSVPGNASGALVTFAGPINATVTLTATNFNCLLITGSGPGGSIGPGGEDPGQVGISCSLTPASVTLTGTEIAGGLATWTVNVGYNPNVSARLGNPTGIFAAAWLGMPGLLLLGSFNSKQRSRRRTIVQILGTLLILVALLQGVGCGGGGGGSAASGTPAGVYQLLVQGTGSDGATYSAVVPVNVEASGTTSP